MIENFILILPDEHEAQDCVVFPSEDEIMDSLMNREPQISTGDVDNQDADLQLAPNQPVAVMWDSKNNRKRWYIGFFLDTNNDGTH